ncbi:hypothetical protein X798_06509, partial [Onchocerca flexuosa]
MINKRQRECVLSKWSPNLAIFRNQPKAVYTDFYQNICLSSWDQIQHFTIAPPRTTFSVPISNKRLLLSNSDNSDIENYKSVNIKSDISVNRENKKKPSFEMVFHSTQSVPLPNIVNGSIHRFIKSAHTTVSPSQRQTSYDVDYDEDRSSSDSSNKDCDDNNSDDNDNEDYDDDDDDDDDIYYDGSYKNSVRSSDFISSNDAQPITANKDITYRIAGSLLIPFIPVLIDKLIPEWNATTKDSELSIQHRNHTLNIGIFQQNPDKRQMIRDGLIEQLECFHYFANNQLNDYEQEIIKQIGLQDCLHNCILRVAFLCLSVNYKNHTK